MRNKYHNRYHDYAQEAAKKVNDCITQFRDRLHKTEKIADKVRAKKILPIEGVNQLMKVTEDYAHYDFSALNDADILLKALKFELKKLPKDAE